MASMTVHIKVELSCCLQILITHIDKAIARVIIFEYEKNTLLCQENDQRSNHTCCYEWEDQAYPTIDKSHALERTHHELFPNTQLE